MPINQTIPQELQIRLTSSVETIRASLLPYEGWIEKKLGVPMAETLILEVDCNPGDAIAQQLLCGLPIVTSTHARNDAWRALIEEWKLPSGISPQIAVSHQRERQSNASPRLVWDVDWQNSPLALKFRGLGRHVISVKVPQIFPPGDMPLCAPSSSSHWFIVHRHDAATVLLHVQHVMSQTERYLETGNRRTPLKGRYDWNSLVLDSTVRRMVKNDFEIFFQREDWFRQHNLPYRRGYLFWGPPGNGKSATLRVMTSHPHIRAFSLDLSDADEKSSDVSRVFEKAGENTPALVILEDLDRAFPTEGKRTKERSVSFQTLLNCLDGVGTQDGVIVVATANDPTCLDAAILKRPGRFDRVVHFRNPDPDLRREYYQRLSPVLAGKYFEPAIEMTEGYSFAQLRETYILGAQCAFEHGREVTVSDVIEAIELQAAGALDVKSSVAASGFVRHDELSVAR